MSSVSVIQTEEIQEQKTCPGMRDELTQFCVLLYWLPCLMCREFKRQPWHSPDSRAKLRHALLEGEIPAPVLPY